MARGSATEGARSFHPASPSPQAGKERELAAYLGRAWRAPFAWGAHDCFTFPADWVALNGRGDPLARVRGRYATQLGAQRLLKREGGALTTWRRELAALRVARTEDPGAGDVALVRFGDVTAGAIRSRIGWAMLTVRGLVVTRHAEPIATWRI